MQFCPECENLLYPMKKKNGKYLVCKFCGYEQKLDAKKDISEDYRIGENSIHEVEVEIMEEDEPLPKVVIECPKCSNAKAFHWERYNDDGEIIPLYKCTKCKHVWADTD